MVHNSLLGLVVVLNEKFSLWGVDPPHGLLVLCDINILNLEPVPIECFSGHLYLASPVGAPFVCTHSCCDIVIGTLRCPAVHIV